MLYHPADYQNTQHCNSSKGWEWWIWEEVGAERETQLPDLNKSFLSIDLRFPGSSEKWLIMFLGDKDCVFTGVIHCLKVLRIVSCCSFTFKNKA